jgi:hypothetical protein
MKQNYAFKDVGNAHEMVMYFDMPQNYTVHAEGEKDVKIRKAGYQKQQVMVMMCITADGHEFPPYNVLTHNMMLKNEMFPKDIIVHEQRMNKQVI